MNLFVFLDLDDSIFQTRRKCPPQTRLQPGAVDREGGVNSWLTPAQDELFQMLNSLGTIIPTTARNADAFQRVQLPFEHMAILNFGGTILQPDGELDRDWDACIRPQALSRREVLYATLAAVESFAAAHDPLVYGRVIEDFGMPLYLVMKHRQQRTEPLQEIIDADVLPHDDGWFVHLNDNNLSVCPDFLGKHHAVRYIMEERLGAEPYWTIGMGDSTTDGPFLKQCDFVLTPGNSQLAGHWPLVQPSPD